MSVGPGFLSPWHILIFAIVVLVAFGPKRLPEMGRMLGKGMREFKDSVTGLTDVSPEPVEQSKPDGGTPAQPDR